MRQTLGAVLVLLGAMAAPAWAVDGVILIDQNKAMVGNVTPGDAPGFPVSITTTGSFRLASNLTVPTVNTTAIDITSAANAVTIDLNGFSIIGPVSCVIGSGGNPTTCSGAADNPNDIFGPGVGIRSFASEALTVKNGTIRGMGRYALFQSGGPYVIIENLHARENGRGGMRPSVGLILNSNVTNNGGNGIDINQGLIKGTVVARNAGDGIVSTGLPLNIQECQINDNFEFGIVFQGAGGLIGANVIRGNQDGAISGGAPIESSGNYCSGTGCP